MKLSHIISALFAVLGAVVMVVTIGACLIFRNAPTRITDLPAEAESCSRQFAAALDQGDFDTASGLILGQPELGLSGTPQDPAAAAIWGAYLSSVTCTLEGDTYARGTAFYQDVTLTVLDIPSVTREIPALSQECLTRLLDSAEDPAALYTPEGELTQEARSRVLRDAASEALKQGNTATCKGSIQLFQQDGRWWVIPEAKLLDALAGGLD